MVTLNTRVDEIQVHLAAGIGNIVLATPLLVALHDFGFAIDVVLAADYPETAELFRSWSVVRAVFTSGNIPPAKNYQYVLPVIPPFYWQRFAHRFRNTPNLLPRPSDSLFYENEQAFYFSFAQVLGWEGAIPAVMLPIAPIERADITTRTLVLAPGRKTGEMAKKRWPYFPVLAEEFDDVVIVGTADDLCDGQGKCLQFPVHAHNLASRLSLRETAEIIATAGAFVGNDSGLSHIAAAVGTPTVMIFGPTSEQVLGSFPSNVRTLRAGLACEPCWFNARFRSCRNRIDCLAQVSVENVISSLAELGFFTRRSFVCANWAPSRERRYLAGQPLQLPPDDRNDNDDLK
jgi:ADP-heptose:LPS heptosyltransferase